LANDPGQHDHDKNGHDQLETQMLGGSQSSSSDLQETFPVLSNIRRSKMVDFT
jgi:hypothetical protein